MAAKLQTLIDLHNSCLEKEKYMRCKQLALMRERNLYLEKCKRIEEVGNKYNWEGEGGELLGQVHSALFSQTSPQEEDMQQQPSSGAEPENDLPLE